ncbi:MAG: cytochrome C oxidase Cbb3, partial [Bdellovibrionales bacterium]|nr:cytochrome C oxidase Cbb3 [Bdellovibrionales bacterium]
MELENEPSDLIEISYDDKIVKAFTLATLLWGAVAMLLGVTIAFQLADFNFNFNLPWLTFGRLRPLHTNAAIFAFVGNGMFAGVYYSLQRLLKTRLFNDKLSWIHFWGWQAIIVLAAITLPLGFTQGKEYAELIWPIDIAITIVWVIFSVNFF